MRYLIFGDVHGNLPALEKMLMVEMNNYEVLICHGDVVGYGPWSNECVDLLKNVNCICLQGNHEEYFLNGIYSGKNEIAKAFFEFCFPYFHRQDIISNYRNSYNIQGYKIKHTIRNAYIFPDTDGNTLQLDRNYIIGHSHYQFLKKIGEYELYNTGSVGQNRRFINMIDYLVVDTGQNIADFRSIPYDVDVVINQMAVLNYPLECINYYKSKKRACK